MQNDHTTIFELADEADDVMTEMAAAGFDGMTNAQADIVVRMGKLLDKAAKIIGGIALPALPKESAQLINKAANHALAMRMHGATLRGAAGAALLEDLCDAAMGRQIEAAASAAIAANVKEEDRMTVEEAMTMLECQSYAGFAKMLECSDTTVKNWRTRQRLPSVWMDKVRDIYRGMQVREAA